MNQPSNSENNAFVIEKFFKYCGERMCNENDLSDFLYACMRAVPKFTEDFLLFFFGDNEDNKNLIIQSYDNIEIKREWTIKQEPETSEQRRSRPDFCFVIGNKYFVIEIKIYDRDYHFKKYESAINTYSNNSNLSCSGRGSITTYYLPEKEIPDNWVHKQWNTIDKGNALGFTNYILSRINNYNHEALLLRGLIQYMEGVCMNNTEPKVFNLKTLKSYYELNGLISEAVNKVFDDTNSKWTITERPRGNGNYFNGKYYTFVYNNSKLFEIWIGLTFDGKSRLKKLHFLIETKRDINIEKNILEKFASKNNELNNYELHNYPDEEMYWIGIRFKNAEEIFKEGNTYESQVNAIKDMALAFINILVDN